MIVNILWHLACIVPSAVLVVAGVLVVWVSSPASRQAVGGGVAAVVGALGAEISLHWLPPEVMAGPLLLLCIGGGWLFLFPHRSPALQAWSLSDRAALGDR